MIDTHCHVDMFSNPMEIVKESERLGIITIGMTNLPSHFKLGRPHLNGFRRTRLALGMHPLMAQRHAEEFTLFYRYLDETSYIGEIGLDFSKEGIKTKERQINSFEKILEAVCHKPKILSIHSRRAEKEVLQLLKKHQIENAIFHWYSGGLKLIDEIVDCGYFLSVNPAMIRSDSGKKIINRIPEGSLLTESDGPFTYGESGEPNRPVDVKYVIEYIAKSRKRGFSDVNAQIRINFNELLTRLA